MLKFMIEKLEDVEEQYRSFYEEKDGKFYLKVDGLPGAGDGDGDGGSDAIRNKLKQLLDEKKKEADKRRELEDKLALEKAKNEEDRIKLLEQQGKYKEAYEAREAEYQRKLTEAEDRAKEIEETMKQTMVEVEVSKLAADLAGDSAFIMEPHLRSRFETKEVDGVLTVVAKDKDGNETTTEKLAEEFRASKQWEKILVGRNSSGGGGGGGDAGNIDDWEKYYKLGSPEYSLDKQVELAEKDLDKHNQLVKKYNLDSPELAAIPAAVNVRR